MILPDGTISEGWIGGGCARAAVLKAAKDALADGQLAARLGAAAGCARRAGRRGRARSRRACGSPRTCARARAPWTFSSSRYCRGRRWSSAARARSRSRSPISPGGPASPSPCARLRPSRPRSARPTAASKAMRLPVDDAGARFVVVSTQGRGDEAALLAALAVDADYVAFVGSRKKAEALKATLGERGVAAERLAKLKAPGRPRPRRDHPGRDRDLDPGGDRRGAAHSKWINQSSLKCPVSRRRLALRR